MLIDDMILDAVRRNGVEIQIKNLDTYTLSLMIHERCVRAMQDIRDIVDSPGLDDGDRVSEIAAVLDACGMGRAIK